jgi:hypothetical protein
MPAKKTGKSSGMTPESEPSESPAAKRARRPRQRRSLRSSIAGEPAVARVFELVAAIRAEQRAGGEARPIPASERAKLFTALRGVLAAREHERAQWHHQLLRLESELGEARAASERLRAELDRAQAQHRRAIEDLKLLHEHQHSIWQLERRRLEITVDAYEQARRNRLFARAAGFVRRPASLAALLLVSLVTLALARDTGAAAAGFRLYLDDARQFFLATSRGAAPPAAAEAIDGRAARVPFYRRFK